MNAATRTDDRPITVGDLMAAEPIVAKAFVTEPALMITSELFVPVEPMTSDPPTLVVVPLTRRLVLSSAMIAAGRRMTKTNAVNDDSLSPQLLAPRIIELPPAPRRMPKTGRAVKN